MTPVEHFLADPDPELATLLHACPGCDSLTCMRTYCQRCSEEIEALRSNALWKRCLDRQAVPALPLRSAALVTPNWRTFAAHLVALLCLAAACWAVCAL